MVGESGAAELTAGRYFINVNVLIARLIATRFDRAPRFYPYVANRAEIARLRARKEQRPG